MVNIGLNPGSLLGIALAVAGAALYLLRSQRPALARDHDIFFAAVALLSGGILFFQGWRLDPILQFLQFLLAGSAVFYAYDGIRLRGVATQQAKRNTPIVDDERPVSPVYRAYQEAQFDELNPYEERRLRRIPGSREPRSNRDDYEDDVRPRRTSNRISGEERLGPGDRPRRISRTRNRPERPVDYPASPDDIDFREDRPSRSRGSSSRPNSESVSTSRPRRSRPSSEEPIPPRDRGMDAEVSSSEYVDYRPIDDEEDNWGNY
ncbi:Ycf66 family protein [Leptothermofonsia sp. ETS-13]|uniref:Ycf66 family protein n=1 Tax=Leptothermofonsia sp. ETS-13 TaxID=3035696 RepID=UPI003BA062F2